MTFKDLHYQPPTSKDTWLWQSSREEWRRRLRARAIVAQIRKFGILLWKDGSLFKSKSMDYLNNWIHQQLPKPIPIYAIPIYQEESVIKSTKTLSDFLPKCNSPTIVCHPPSKSKTPNAPEVSSSKSTSSRRLSYSREYKLLVIYYFLTDGQKNKYRTCKQFRITKSMLNGWLQKADKIFNSREGAKKTGSSGRKPQFSEVEEKLYHLYLEQKERGYEVSLGRVKLLICHSSWIIDGWEIKPRS